MRIIMLNKMVSVSLMRKYILHCLKNITSGNLFNCALMIVGLSVFNTHAATKEKVLVVVSGAGEIPLQ